jgi:hypothetical protein
MVRRAASYESTTDVTSPCSNQDLNATNDGGDDLKVHTKETGGFQCMNSIRLVVLGVLCFQNSMYTVLRRYSQGVLMENYSKVCINIVNQNQTAK